MLRWRLPERNRRIFIDEEGERTLTTGALSSRSGILKAISENIKAQGLAVLVGLSGTGKTTLSIEYAYENISSYDEIFFIHGEDFVTQLQEIVFNLFAINTDNLSFFELMSALFGKKSKRLFVIDDFNISEQLDSFINYAAEQLGADLIITSISQHWDNAINVHTLKEAESIAFIKGFNFPKSARVPVRNTIFF